MSGELKLCPLCGSEAMLIRMLIEDEISFHLGAGCSDKDCPMHQPFYLHVWNNRPLKDALIAERDALRIEVSEIQHGFELQHKAAIDFMHERDALRKQLESVNNENAYLHFQLDDTTKNRDAMAERIKELRKAIERLSVAVWINNDVDDMEKVINEMCDIAQSALQLDNEAMRQALAKINAITNEDGHIAKNDGGGAR